MIKAIQIQPSLVEQVHKAILTEISTGRFRAGERIIQEQLAKDLGVSRQPVQQALALLRSQDVLRDAPGRGLQVAPLDPAYVRHMYEVRAVIEGLAFRKAAEARDAKTAAEGAMLIQVGRKAVASKSVSALIAADMAFHEFIYGLSGNPLLAPAMATHWTNAQRVMGEVLGHDNQSRNVWGQHEALLEAVVAGRASAAEKLAKQHITDAADFMIARLAA